MSRYQRQARRRQPMVVTVRRVDGAFRVAAHEPGLEHTHDLPFPTYRSAYGLVCEIRSGLAHGADLSLDRHWSTEPVDESIYRELRRDQLEEMRRRNP